jgi:hypothetical protein
LRKILAAELICWRSLHIFFFAIFPLWQCTILILGLLKMIQPWEEKCQEAHCSGNTVLTGNDKRIFKAPWK